MNRHACTCSYTLLQLLLLPGLGSGPQEIVRRQEGEGHGETRRVFVTEAGV